MVDTEGRALCVLVHVVSAAARCARVTSSSSSITPAQRSPDWLKSTLS